MSFVTTGAPPLSPVLMSIEELAVPSQVAWFPCDLQPDVVYRLRALVDGRAGTMDHAALVCFEVPVPQWGPSVPRGLALSQSVGPYLYLRSGPGLHRTDRFFTVPGPVSRIGLMAWGDRGDAVVKALTVERTTTPRRGPAFFLSLDVEALPGRAQSDPIDTLVWGRLGGGEYGLRRLCDILDQHRIRANFLVDFASCGRDGDRPLAEILEFLRGSGHEIHLHLHSELLARDWGLTSKDPMYLDSCGYDLARSMLDHAATRYVRLLGEDPVLFRSGGYRCNAELVLASRSLGIRALSNIREETLVDRTVKGDPSLTLEPFRWTNDMVEIPVDYAPDPLSHPFQKYLDRYTELIRGKSAEPTFNVVLHSWSLTSRDERGYHSAFAPAHEDHFHRICEHINQNGVAYGYGQYLAERQIPRPVSGLSRIRISQQMPWPASVATCIICQGQFSRRNSDSDSCPTCSCDRRQRKLRYVIDTYGDLFAGKSVLAHRSTVAWSNDIFTGAVRVTLIGSELENAHPDEVLFGLTGLKSRTFDRVLGCGLTTGANDDVLLKEIARVLTAEGVLVTLISCGEHSANPAGTGCPELQAHIEGLSPNFSVTSVPGFDELTNGASHILLAVKRSKRSLDHPDRNRSRGGRLPWLSRPGWTGGFRRPSAPRSGA